tara:strand:+ start:8301 stop:9605 length:1305 start_codon:yes stop_codon:yes gene_type:complete
MTGLQSNPLDALGDVSSDVRWLEVDDIHVPEDRLREVNQDAVYELLESIERNTQLQAIVVNRRVDGSFVLVDGAHRLAAVDKLGWDKVKAVVFRDLGEEKAQLLEIDANLRRLELSALQKAEQIALRETIIYRDGQAKRGRGNPNFKADDEGEVVTTMDLARQVRMTRRKYEQFRQVGQKLCRDAKETLKETPYAKSTTLLIEISRLEEDDQTTISEELSMLDHMKVGEAKKYIKERVAEWKAARAEAGSITWHNSDWRYSGKDTIPAGSIDMIASEGPMPDEDGEGYWGQLSEFSKHCLNPETGIVYTLLSRPQLSEALRVFLREFHLVDVLSVGELRQPAIIRIMVAWSPNPERIPTHHKKHLTYRGVWDFWDEFLAEIPRGERRSLLDPHLRDHQCGAIASRGKKQGFAVHAMSRDKSVLARAQRGAQGKW